MRSSMLSERVRAQLAGLAVAGLDLPTYARSALDALTRAVPFAAACFATADPATGLVTGTVKTGGLSDARDEEWAHYEYEVPDPSAFVEVVRRPGGVLALGTDTGGRPELSPRFGELIRPTWHFDDELRAALRTEGGTWGFLALFRDGPGAAFTVAEQEFVSGVGAALAGGLRAGILASAAVAAVRVDGPAVLVVDEHGEVVSASVGAAARVDDLGGGVLGRAPLPLALLALVAAARQCARDADPAVPKVRLRTRSGAWVVAHASRLLSRSGATSDVVLTIEEARPPEIVPLVVAAFGLTAREQEVVALVLQGVDTTGIAGALHLSAYTVQDHLKAVFAKVGVRSRRELIARVFHDQYAPNLAARAPLAPSGWFADAGTPAVPAPRSPAVGSAPLA
ncbi:helix-turn-helix transcriptional regulator [Blastococcus sp. CCUG 61487]|uniref:response regulator transcription factor n=1 Tax=Blastococcus sp. CCUG 61487 TaxID=1840703 RepID=UPI001BAE7BFB|nr:helix-turn-helix transcriptional regulator [Blastococcus sp. CCUG 61487]